MKKVFAAIFALLFIFIAPSALALQRSGDTVTLPATETVNEDYFASGNNITLSGTVNGDAFLGAGNIMVDGTINGDLLALGGNIDIRGNVTGDIRAVGGQINVSGNVGRSLSVAGGSVNLASTARVGRNLAIGAGSANIASRVGGDVTAAGQINLAPTANIVGDLTYWSADQVQIPPGAIVSGTITQNQPPAEEVEPGGFLAALAAAQIWFAAAFFIAYLVIGLLMLRFTPAFLKETTEQISKKPWASLGIGFLTLIATPVIIFIFFITLLGIPLGLAVLSLFTLAIFLSKVFVSLFLGRKIFDLFNFKAAEGWALLAGIIVYLILAGIPFLGGLVILAAASFGLGALILALKPRPS